MIAGDLLKASGRTLATTSVIVGVGFFSSVITARILGPEGRGLLSAALLVATLSAGISQFGLANSFVYHKGADRRFPYGRLLAFSLLIVCVLAVLLAIAGLEMGGNTSLREQVVLIACLAGFTAAQSYLMTLSQVHSGLIFFNMMRVGLVCGNLAALLLLLAILDMVSYRDLLLSQLLVVAILVVAGLAWSKKMLARSASISPAAGRTVRWWEVIRYGVAHHGTVFLGIVLLNFDKIVLLQAGTMVQFGFYALAFTTSRLIGALQEAASTALFSRFAGRNVEQLTLGVKAAFRLTFLPMLAIGALGAVLAPWFIVLIFGQAFAPMAGPFAILLFECVIGNASWMLAQRFSAGGRPGMVFLRQLISVLPIFVAVPFLPQHNITLYLSGLMLLGAILRLGVTVALYPMVLKESVPGILPTKDDIRTLRSTFSKESGS